MFKCILRPRCPRVIAQDSPWRPYSLKVAIVENRRAGGKVKQQTVASLGTVDATFLAAFWQGIPDADALQCDDWDVQSLRVRAAFWQKAGQRLDRLANRLGPEAKRIRDAIVQRVPEVTAPERQRLDYLDTRADLERSDRSLRATKEVIRELDQHIVDTERLMRELTTVAQGHAENVDQAALKLFRMATDD